MKIFGLGLVLLLLYCIVLLQAVKPSRKRVKSTTGFKRQRPTTESKHSKKKFHHASNQTASQRGAIHFYLKPGSNNILSSVNELQQATTKNVLGLMSNNGDINEAVNDGDNRYVGSENEAVEDNIGEKSFEYDGHTLSPVVSPVVSHEGTGDYTFSGGVNHNGGDFSLSGGTHIGSPNNFFQENEHLFSGVKTIHDGVPATDFVAGHSTGHGDYPLPVHLNQHLYDGPPQHVYKSGREITNGPALHMPAYPPVHILRGPQIELQTKPQHVNVHLHTYEKVGKLLWQLEQSP